MGVQRVVRPLTEGPNNVKELTMITFHIYAESKSNRTRKSATHGTAMEPAPRNKAIEGALWNISVFS